jgi:hypothetical protein
LGALHSLRALRSAWADLAGLRVGDRDAGEVRASADMTRAAVVFQVRVFLWTGSGVVGTGSANIVGGSAGLIWSS